MRLKDKIISLLLALIMVTATASVFAEESSEGAALGTVYFNEDFESYAVGKKAITGFTVTAGENKAGVVELADGNAYRLDALNSTGLYIDYFFSEPISDCAVLQMRTMMPDTKNVPRKIIATTDTGSKVTLLTLSGSSVMLGDGRRIGGFIANKFYELAMVIRMDSGEYDVYFNGKLRSCNASLSGESITSLRWDLRNPSDNCSWIIDDLKMYYSDTIIDDEDATEDTENDEGSSNTATVLDISKVKASSLCMCLDSDNALAYGVTKKTSGDNVVMREENENVLVPAAFFAQNIGASYSEEAGMITIARNNKTATFTVGTDEMITAGQTVSLPVGARNFDGVSYVPAIELCDALDMYLFLDAGLLVCSEKNWNLSWSENLEELRTLCESFIYDDVSGAQIVNDVKAMWAEGEHPRMLFTQSRFDEIKAELAKGDECDPVYKRLYTNLKKKCDSYINTAAYQYEFTDGVRLMSTCDKMQTRFLSLAIMYNLTGIEDYAERAWVEMLAACSFKDWHPWHFLDTGIMASGMGLAYDWLYNWMTEERREIVRDAIIEHAITQVINDYKGTVVKVGDTGNLLSRSTFWAYGGGNWQFPAGGGVGTAALAICTELADEELELAEFAMEQGLVTIRKGISDWAPHGAYEDGVNYWGFASMYFGRWIGSIITSTGKNYGYLDSPGLDETLDWHMSTNGPVAKYAFHDNETGASSSGYTYLIWSKLLDEPEKAQPRIRTLKTTAPGSYEDFLWYSPELDVGTEGASMALDNFSESIGVVSTRSSWASSATWLGFHADNGLHKPSHMHMDGGSFAIQSQGENFFYDLGSDDYTLPNYRVTAYRCRAEGHNGILLNPGQGQYGDYDMQYDGQCKVDKYVSKPRGVIALANVTDLWREDLESGWRGVKFDNYRRTITVQDELVMKKPSEFYWFAHTDGVITVSDDGKTAVITVNGKSMIAEITEGDGAVFSVMEAKPLPTSPACPGQDENAGVSKLTIHMTDVSKLNLTVVFNIFDENFEDLEYSKEFVPMAEWTIPDGENTITYAQADSISVDGVALEEFDPEIYTYNVSLPAGTTTPPTITATSSVNELNITQASSCLGGAAIVQAMSDGKSIPRTYKILFSLPGSVGLPTGVTEIRPVAISASQVPQAENAPENVADGDLATKWAAKGQGDLTYDLGAVKNIHSIAFALASSTSRTAQFSLSISLDGLNWTQIYKGDSLYTEDYEHHLVGGAQAKYVRFTGYGHSGATNNWTSLLELKVFE